MAKKSTDTSTSTGSTRYVRQGVDLHYATSPLLASKTPPWRSRLVVFLVGLAFAALIGRAIYVQLVRADFHQRQGEKRFAHTVELDASRGRILDRNGLLLAGSVPAPSVWVDPQLFRPTDAQRRALLQALAMKPEELTDRLEIGGRYVWLRRQVDDATAARLEALKPLKIEGLQVEQEFRRRYPEGEAAAHVVGTTGITQNGLEGIELAFDRQLQGQGGSRFVVKDRRGRVVEDIVERTEPVHGQDIQLALDSKVQFFAYQRIREAVAEHGAKAGSVVVLDAVTGEVLALANAPGFNPADRRKLSDDVRRNRALTDVFEPGSTIKPLTAALALDQGRVTPQTVIATAPGSIVIGNRTIRDTHPGGDMTVAQVIQKSSNVGTVKLAMTLADRDMWEMFASVGFGQRPQIAFPGAVTGRLRVYKNWVPVDKATMSYGYGLSASLLQLARAYTVFARDGEVIPLSILKQPLAEDGQTPQPVAGQRVFKPETARAVRQMLYLATQPGGTATAAVTPGYSVGGKTGTAKKLVGKTYSNTYRAWFVGIAPIHQPRIVVAVMVDEPSRGKFYGGLVAAPVFSQVVQQTLRTLNVPPDLEVKSQVQVVPVPPEPESFER
jgi:cell division protein FtsI (penicillin-binding protein 3)